MSGITLTKSNDAYSGQDTTGADIPEILAQWTAPSTIGWFAPADGAVKLDIQDATPAAITDGDLIIQILNPSGNKHRNVLTMGLDEIPSWANQTNVLQQIQWGEEFVVPPFWKLQALVESSTAAVIANSKFALKVVEMEDLTPEEVKSYALNPI